MADIILIAVTIAFFAICALYVQWCDRIIGPDEFGSKPESADSADDADSDLAEHTEVMA